MIKLLFASVLSSVSSPALANVPGDTEITTLQWLLNAAFGALGVLGGWLIHLLHQAIRDLQKTDYELVDKVHLIEVLVAGQYVKKDELERLSITLFSKLDRIEQKLDNKVDRE